MKKLNETNGTTKTEGSIEHTSKYGESAIFYALRAENWEFLKTFVNQDIQIRNDDFATRKLLLNRYIFLRNFTEISKRDCW